MFKEEDLELGRRAIDRRWITQAQMEECLREVEDGKTSLADALVRRGLLQTAQVIDVLKEIHPPTRSLAAGEKFGKYDIVREIGRGGMGVVYEAVDRDLGRRVALKVLAQRILPSHEDAERFLREARLAARLRHPNLVAVHDFGILDESPYFTMELIEGRTLDRLLDEPASDLRAAVDVLRRTALAVHAAHEAGVIHRDLKPANIILDAKNEPHVTDFGLARDLKSQTVLTQSGTAMGTPSYMAPEQAMGLRESMDARTDVYCLGVILYQALTRQLPFLEPSMTATLMKVATDDPRRPRDVDPEIDRALETVCLKAMARDRTKRYATALDFAEDLGRWLRGEPIAARAPGPVDAISRSARRHPALVAAVLVGGFALGAFFVFLQFRPAKLRIENPSGAVVEVDGIVRPPGELTLRKGKHRIRARLEEHRDWAMEVDLGPGETRSIEIRMERREGRLVFAGLPAETHVVIWADPPLRFDARPAPVRLPVGSYRVQCWAPGTVMAVRDVMIFDRADTLLEVDLESALVWRHAANDGVYRAPLVQGDTVAFVSKDRHLRILDARGTLLRSHDTRHEGHSDLVLAEGRAGEEQIVFGCGAAGVLSLRSSDLAPRFFHKTSHMTFVTPVGAGREGCSDFLLCTWEGEVSVVSGLALNTQARPVVWARSVGAGRKVEVSGPAGLADLDGDQGMEVIVASDTPEIVVLNAVDGTDRFRLPLAARPSSPLSLVDVDQDFAADLVIGLEDGTVLCISGRTRKPLWQWKGSAPVRIRPLGADFDLDSRLEIVIGSEDGALVCLGARNGAFRWRYRAGAPIRSWITAADVDGDRRAEVLFGAEDEKLRVVDAVTGELLWYFRAAGGIAAGPVVADLDRDGAPEILFGSDDRHLYAVRVRQASGR